MIKLLKSFSAYTFASFLQQGVSFLLLPIFTNYLLPADYGILANLTILLAFVSPFILMTANGAINVEYIREESGCFSSYFSSALWNVAFSFLILMALFFATGHWIASWLNLPYIWVVLIPIIAFFNSLITIQLSLFQIQKRVFNYCVLSITNSLLNILIAFFLVVFCSYKYEGRMMGLLVAYTLIGLICLYLFFRQNLLTTDVKQSFQKDVFKYGIPLIPHTLGHIIINASDRIFITKMVNLDELGIYHIGYTIGSIIFVLAVSFNNAWVPNLYERLKTGTEKTHLEVLFISVVFLVLLSICAIVLTLISPVLFDLFIGEEYYSGLIYVGWIAMSYFFLGGYLVFANFLFYLKKTQVFVWLALINILINLALNYVLIKSFGTIGAAYATAISFLIFSILTGIVSHHISPMPWKKLPAFANLVIRNRRF